MLYYATADKTELVPESDPRARYVVNPADPGEFAPLLRAREQAALEAAAQAQADATERDARAAAEDRELCALPVEPAAKAQAPAEDKAQRPGPDKGPAEGVQPAGGAPGPTAGRSARRHP